MVGLTGGGYETGRSDVPAAVMERRAGQRRAAPETLPFRAALEVCPDAALVLSPQWEPLFANAAWRALFGQQAVGPAEFLTAPSVAYWQDSVLAALPGPGWEGVLDAKDATGRTFPLWLKAISICPAAGAEPLFVLYMRDHSSWHRSQAELRAAKDEVQRAQQSKSKFLSHASHDLRQPLQALNMFATVLAGRLAEPDLAALVGRIQDSVTALESLLNGLLDISKLEAGLVETTVEPFSLHAMLERLQAEFAPAAQAAGLKLSMVPSRATIRSDSVLLERLLRHLVNNAIRFTPQGRVLVGCRRRGDALVIEVHDTGIGIAAAELDNIFKEFHQLTNSNRDRRQGLGLGLAIVERSARLLGHRLRVESQPGKGSVFSVEVPLVRHMPWRPSAQLSLGMSRRGLSILVLDDDTDVMEGLTMLLESWGHAVVAAGSPVEMLVKAERLGRTPDLVIADYRLQNGTTGAQVISRLRSRLKSRIPAILLTGDTAPERLRQAKASGNDLLHKPVRPDDLAQAIEVAMDRAQASLLPNRI